MATTLNRLRTMTLKGVLRDADMCNDLLEQWGGALDELSNACGGTTREVRASHAAVMDTLRDLRAQLEKVKP